MIDTFTKQQFEQALPTHNGTSEPLWEYLGLLDGEHVYAIQVNGTNKRIVIRSSVKSDGMSADTGEDSIRLWVEYHYKDKWFALGKLDAWTTRVSGWQERMETKLRELWKLALEDSKRRSSNGNGGQETNVPLCPECNAEMVVRERSWDRAKFYGCPNFPNCRGTRPYTAKLEPKQEPKEFTPSRYQKAIFEFVESGTGHGVVEAVAGSGKTTTIVKALEYTDPDSKVGFVAFNRHIAKELASRAPEHVHVSTLHSLGYSNIRNAFGNVTVEPRKLWHIVADTAEKVAGNYQVFDTLQANGQPIMRLVSLCKANLLEPTPENLEWIADRWNVETNGITETVHHLVKLVYEKSIEQTDVIDYDDMIFFSAIGTVPCERFDVLFIDECQDLNKAQIAMALRSVNDAGRIIAVGDRWQSIYGFRGADVDAIPNVIEALDATVLPLSISYRCPKSHVQLAQRLVPQIEAADDAKEGTIGDVTEFSLYGLVEPGDLVLCRTNAPLVGPAFGLIRQGVKAVILGRDIGKGLMDLVKKVQKKYKVYGLDDTLGRLAEYVDGEVRKLRAAKKAMRAQTLVDQEETILALANGCDTVAQLQRRTEQVFSDDAKGVVFSTVHKAKGGEADKVFILRPDLMPHPKAEAAWEQQQERNIKYVALTRSKNELYFVR